MDLGLVAFFLGGGKVHTKRERQRTLLTRVLKRRVLETAFKRVLRRVLRRCRGVGSDGRVLRRALESSPLACTLWGLPDAESRQTRTELLGSLGPGPVAQKGGPKTGQKKGARMVYRLLMLPRL